MHRISRHIARTVFSATLVVLAVVLALDVIGTFLGEIEDIDADYNMVEILIYTGLSMLGRVYDYLPYVVLIGCLVGLGALANASELVVIRSAGVSVGRIIWMVLKPVLWFIAFGVFLAEFVIPYTDQFSESRRALAQGERQALQTERGLWNREGNEYMYFNAVQPNGVLYGVTRYQFDGNQRLLEASYADQAIYQRGYWQEEDVAYTRMEEQQTVTGEQRFRRWDTELTPTLLNIVALEPESLSVRNLYFYAQYLGDQELDNGQYRLAFWQKLLQPLAIVSLVLIAISFIFGPLREVTMGQRIFTGVAFGILFRLTQSLLGPSSLLFGFSPIVAAAAPIVGSTVLGIYMLRRAG